MSGLSSTLCVMYASYLAACDSDRLSIGSFIGTLVQACT